MGCEQHRGSPSDNELPLTCFDARGSTVNGHWPLQERRVFVPCSDQSRRDVVVDRIERLPDRRDYLLPDLASDALQLRCAVELGLLPHCTETSVHLAEPFSEPGVYPRGVERFALCVDEDHPPRDRAGQRC